MKVTLNWLKEYVDFSWSPEELRERLTMLGIEVEGMQKIAGEFEGVVVAQVMTCDKHPNADKLSVCQVDHGGQQRQIVCGAKNFKVGDKVPLALPGTAMPTPAGEPPFTIKVGKIRGVESHGMMCSPKELGLADDAQGLMILAQDAQVGQPFATHLGRASSDVVYDLEITPNRPDLNSVIGIAREIAALTGNPLRIPVLPAVSAKTAAADEKAPTAETLVGVELADPELCPRYVARVIRGVKVGASPDWLRSRLEKIGLRSINNVVDVTNFVMLETGQPLHAFDYHLLGKSNGRPVIVVRRAADSEKFVTLDGQERTLTSQMLLIADEAKAIALAGVMGGQNSEINLNTADVLLESAYFKPQNIRATSKKLELRTDASYRFERGADIEICDWASRRAAQLILETAGGNLVPGAVDAYPTPFTPRQITLRHSKVTELVGVPITPAQNVQFLRQLSLQVDGETETQCSVTAPSYRVDLKREIDLIEEIVRLYGVEKIPPTPPRGAIGSHAYDALHDDIDQTRRILSGLGLTEAQGQTLISNQSAALVSEPEPSAAAAVALGNPLSSDMNVLRPSLLPGLLEALRHNLNHKSNDIALFEIGRVFVQSNGQLREERRLAVALTGQRYPRFWSGPEREAKFDIYDLKGIVEELFETIGVRGAAFQRRPSPTRLYIESAGVQLGKLPLGEIGQVLPTLAKTYDLRDPAFVAEFNLDQLLARRTTAKSFKALPAFPSVRRDVAMIVPESTEHEAVLNVVKQAKAPNLVEVELFDVFRGKNVPAGQKSVAYAFTYRNAERTLTDAEVNSAHEKLVTAFKQSLNAAVRE